MSEESMIDATIEACFNRADKLGNELDSLAWWRIFRRYEVATRLECVYDILCRQLRMKRLYETSPHSKPAQEIEVLGFDNREDGFWLLVNPSIAIYKGMKMREAQRDAVTATSDNEG